MIIDPKSNVPIYRQIVEQVRSAIDAKVYRPNEALPSLRALALEIRVNPNTVQRAYEELERQGVICSRRGIGVFVVDRRGHAPRAKIEKSVAAELRRGIKTGLDAKLTPTRIRELFESTLNACVTKARSQR